MRLPSLFRSKPKPQRIPPQLTLPIAPEPPAPIDTAPPEEAPIWESSIPEIAIPEVSTQAAATEPASPAFAEASPQAFDGDAGEWIRAAREARNAGQNLNARDFLQAAAQRFPDNREVHHDLARLAEAEQNWPAAEQSWRAYLALTPDAGWAVRQIAQLLTLQGQRPEAEALLAESLAQFPDETASFIDHARLVEARGDWVGAALLWGTIAERFPDRWEGLTGQGRALRQQGQPDQARQVLERAAEQFPTVPWPAHELVQTAETTRDWPEMERWWRAFLAIDPGPWWAHTGLAYALREQQRSQEAEAVLAACLDSHAADLGIFVEHARLAEHARDWDAANQRWQRVVAQFPESWEGYSGQARALREQGQPDQARDVLEYAVERFPTSPGPLHDLARLAEHTRDWPDAERWWRAFLAIDPAPWWAHAGLANALREQQRIDQAEDVLTACLESHAGDLPIAVEYARLADHAQDWPASRERWQTVTERFPNAWEGYSGHARALRELGAIDRARSVLTTAAIVIPGALNPRVDLARLEEAQQDWPAAESAWRAARDMAPGIPWVHTHLATMLHRQNQFAAAAEVLSDAGEAFPDEPEIAIGWARLSEAQGNKVEAARWWANLSEKVPDRPDGAIEYARVLHDLGELDRAAKSLRAAIEKFPGNVHLLLHAARLSVQRGLTDDAMDYLQRVIALEPENPFHYTFLSQILVGTSDISKAEQGLTLGLEKAGDTLPILLELARLSERKGNWHESVERYLVCREQYPADISAVLGLAYALCHEGHRAEADALLLDQIDLRPGMPELVIAFARVPVLGGSVDVMRHRERALDALARYPENVDVHRLVADACLSCRLPYEAEQYLYGSVERFPADRGLRQLLAQALARQEKWDAAFGVYADILASFGNDPNTLRDYVNALIAAKRLEDAKALIRNARMEYPFDHGFGISLLNLLISQGELTEATTLWKDLDAIEGDVPLLRHNLFELRTILLGHGIDPAASGRGPQKYTFSGSGDDPVVKEIVLNFESLGGAGLGCEFGGFQRFYGAEPLGLLRWTEMQPEQLVAALEAEFDGVGTEEQTNLWAPEQGSDEEWRASDRRFGMVMHTFVRVDQVPEAEMFDQLCRRLRFLRTEFLEDLREGNKIFVYKNAFRTLTDTEIDRIHRAIRRYGNATLLYVRRQDEDKRFPLVEEVAPGLQIGYIDKFQVRSDGIAASIPTTSWAELVKNSHRLWQNASHRELPGSE